MRRPASTLAWTRVAADRGAVAARQADGSCQQSGRRIRPEQMRDGDADPVGFSETYELTSP